MIWSNLLMKLLYPKLNYKKVYIEKHNNSNITSNNVPADNAQDNCTLGTALAPPLTLHLL